jgi:cysteine desulfurase
VKEGKHMQRPVYLDYNGTTPHDTEVIQAMRPFLEQEFGNPSSAHFYGHKPKAAVETARRQVARLLECGPSEIVFTSGGTESNNHAIRGIARSRKSRGRHIITSTIEHPAVSEVCRFLEGDGFETTFVPVNGRGVVDIQKLRQAVRPDTILITIMHANNEVGTIQPIAEIAQIAAAGGIAMHTDAAQSVGKMVCDVRQLGVDLLSLAGHKLYAPKGVGALFVKQGVLPEKFCFGAGQESGWRAGTENVLEIVGLGKACEIAARDLGANMAHLKAMRDRLHQGLVASLEDVRLNGHDDQRLPNTLSLSFKALEADRILDAIGDRVAASAGAACHSGGVKLSHVLEAMQVPEPWAKGTIRFSVGRITAPEEIDQAIAVVVEAVSSLRS